MKDNLRYWYFELLRHGVPKWLISGIVFCVGVLLVLLMGAAIVVYLDAHHDQLPFFMGFVVLIFIFFVGAAFFADDLPDDPRKKKDDIE